LKPETSSIRITTAPAASSEAPGEATVAQPSLRRGLSALGATTLVAGAVIGSGIYLSPSIVAQQTGAPGLSMAVWLLCGGLALCGGLCFAELGAAIPRTGGTYAFLQRAFRVRWLPFLFGWSMFAVVLTGVMAAVATAFATYAGHFLSPHMSYGVWPQRLVAVACIAFLTIMNVVGVRVGGRIQIGLTSIKVAALAALIVAGLLLPGERAGSLAPFLPAAVPAGSVLAAFGTAMIVALFAYNGWWYSTFVADEVRAPRRSIPFSIFAGMGIVLVVYALANYVYLRVLPFATLQQATRPAADVLLVVAGPAGAAFVSAAVMVSAFGTLNAQLLSVPRIYFAMARDGLFFDRVRRVHPRYRTPAVAILVQGAWAAALALSGSYQQIITYTAFPNYFFLGLGVAALIVLRVREPELDRPFRVPLYPLTPVLFLLVFAWYLVNSLWHSFADTMVGILLTLSGVPFYLYWSRKHQ
jgi:basic amino acid/polyamine antiporter, APA family